jgi:hypothetical protein
MSSTVFRATGVLGRLSMEPRQVSSLSDSRQGDERLEAALSFEE